MSHNFPCLEKTLSHDNAPEASYTAKLSGQHYAPKNSWRIPEVPKKKQIPGQITLISHLFPLKASCFFFPYTPQNVKLCKVRMHVY